MTGKLTAPALCLCSRGDFSAALSEQAYSTYSIIFYCQLHCKGMTLSRWGFFHYQLFACVWICREKIRQKWTRAETTAHPISASQIPNGALSMATVSVVVWQKPTTYQPNNKSTTLIPSDFHWDAFHSCLCVCMLSVGLHTKIWPSRATETRMQWAPVGWRK